MDVCSLGPLIQGCQYSQVWLGRGQDSDLSRVELKHRMNLLALAPHEFRQNIIVNGGCRRQKSVFLLIYLQANASAADLPDFFEMGGTSKD